MPPPLSIGENLKLTPRTWQSDALHGPMVIVGDKRRKAYLFSFIDDMAAWFPMAPSF